MSNEILEWLAGNSDEWKRELKRRGARIDDLERERDSFRSQLTDCEKVIQLRNRHELVPNDNCECPCCNLHRRIKSLSQDNERLRELLSETLSALKSYIDMDGRPMDFSDREVIENAEAALMKEGEK